MTQGAPDHMSPDGSLVLRSVQAGHCKTTKIELRVERQLLDSYKPYPLGHTGL